jgi:hypothetical protein
MGIYSRCMSKIVDEDLHYAMMIYPAVHYTNGRNMGRL